MSVRRRLLAAGVVLATAPALANYDSGAFDTGAFDDQAFQFEGTPTVIVPDVLGLDLAAADTELEAGGLDTGATSETCSAEAEGDVVSQAPPAGTQVELGSTVDLVTSSGTPCTGAGGKLRLRLDLRL